MRPHQAQVPPTARQGAYLNPIDILFLTTWQPSELHSAVTELAADIERKRHELHEWSGLGSSPHTSWKVCL